MPELPEVQTIVTDLSGILPGMVFESITASHLRSVEPSVAGFDELVGVAVDRVERRGKFIVVFFEDDWVLTIHLRMSGRVLMREIDDEPLKYERTRLDFDRGSLRFCDMRKFGRVWLSKVDNFEEMTGIWRLGVEPFSDQFNFDKFCELFEGRRGAVKKWLLDQSKIAGIGNIYADEACFYAGVRPDAEISSLSKDRLEKLFNSIMIALKQGIQNRGTSISDFQDAYGKMGTNQELLYVYGRGGKQCLNCSEELVKTRCAGRGTVHCPGCQIGLAICVPKI
ncbi:bifunctional DNA-formamidopyrimidine glycosylase/DNA-(apurinic or apyrimidinic site) lyase [Candidatus Gracilibacteria bacterium]|nr:bifunctional DNA-formamidopyrimidine glycosylase/DNA-(apurinic or apyrimidinic site) lyase [Candidatus Gracilibacteria bacterium]